MANRSTTVFNDNLVSLQDNMLSFALSLTADYETAEDLRQETTLKVLANREKYVDNTNFKGWVFTVMRNLFINNYHRLVRTRNIIDTNADLTFMAPQRDTVGMATPDHDISLGEINVAIDSLGEDLQIPFSMYVAGYKYQEIAETLDLPIGTVKSRIFFARRRLRSLLSDYR